MKKFALLLAIVALFAMSATAFAASATKIQIVSYTANDPHNDADAAGSPMVYFLKGTAPTLGIGIKLILDGTVPDYSPYYAVINGMEIKGGYASNTFATPNVFKISGQHGINYVDDFTMSFGVRNDSGEKIASIASVDATFKPVPIEIGLSSGGEAVNALTVGFEDDVDEDFTLTYDKTMLAGLEAKLGDLKVGALAPGSSFSTSTDVSIMSADVTGPDAAVEGLTVGFDSTKGQLTVKGAATEVNDVKLALYFNKTDARTALVVPDTEPSTKAILATPTSADNSERAYIIAAFDISVEESSVKELIDEVIADPANAAVSEDIAAEIASGNHSFLFVVDPISNRILSLNGKSADIEPLSDDSDMVTMKMAFLAASTSGKLTEWTDAPGYLRVVISDDKGEDLTASFDVSPAELVEVVGGVADIIVMNDSAPNGDYTINVMAEELIVGGSVSAAAKPEHGDLLAQQKISVAKTEEPGSTSGGACAAGSGLAAIVALAMIKRRSR